MKAIYKPVLPILLTAVFFASASSARADETGFLNRTVKVGDETYRYQVYVDRLPAVVVMPQCRKNFWWTQDAMQERALAAFEQSVKEFNRDPAQFHLTGLSMGGYGTRSIPSKYENVGHNSWDKAFAEPELMKWLLGQSLKTVNSTTSEK
jgi:predicted peptidase